MPRELNWQDLSLLCAVGLLILVWPTAHTAALRNFLLVVSLGLCLIPASRAPKATAISTLRSNPASLMIVAITAWILFHTLAISLEPKTSWDEFLGEWVKAVYCFLLGIIVSWRIPNVQRWSLVVILALLIHLLVWIAETIFAYVSTGAYLPRQASLYGGDYGVMSYVATMLLAFLLADAISRQLFINRLTTLPNSATICFGLLALAWTLLLGARNGYFVAALLISAAFIFILRHQRTKPHRYAISVMGGLLIIGVVTVTLNQDARWSSFPEKARISWNLSSSSAWYSGDNATLPQLSDGTQVDASTYYRLSWMHAGLNYIAQHPLGVGFSRHAFGIARHLEHPGAPERGYSHSSLIDWTLGIGIPGTILWIIGLAKVAQQGVRQGFSRQNPVGVLLTLLILDFFARSIIDSNMRDHSLEMFMFLLGLLGTLLAYRVTRHSVAQ